MRRVPLRESLRIIAQGSLNWLAQRPIVVSFEVTDSCTCFCKHCDHGGPRDTSKDLKPSDYKRYMEVLQSLRRSGIRRRAADAPGSERSHPQHQIGFRSSFYHSGFELVAYDQGALSGTAAGRELMSFVSASTFPMSATMTSAVCPDFIIT